MYCSRCQLDLRRAGLPDRCPECRLEYDPRDAYTFLESLSLACRVRHAFRIPRHHDGGAARRQIEPLRRWMQWRPEGVTAAALPTVNGRPQRDPERVAEEAIVRYGEMVQRFPFMTWARTCLNFAIDARIILAEELPDAEAAGRTCARFRGEVGGRPGLDDLWFVHDAILRPRLSRTPRRVRP